MDINILEPKGELSIRTIAMPADTNPEGHIFGGWVLSQMDMAGAIHARSSIGYRVVTVAVDAMKFHKPIQVGDEVSCYTEIIKYGKTSISLKIETWIRRGRSGNQLMVTAGQFTYVAMTNSGEPQEIKINLN